MTPHEFYIYRCHHHMAQADMAKQLGVSRATINRWEKGHRPMPDDIVERLAEREVGTLKHRTAAQEREHRESVEADIAWYRTMRKLYDHVTLLGKRTVPLLPEAVAVLSKQWPIDFALDDAFKLPGGK